MKDRFLSLAVIVLFIAGGWWLYANRYNISDWWRLRGYSPPPGIQELADTTDMSDYGERLFFVYYPQLQDKSTFNEYCDLEDSSLILGCYNGRGIYILDVEEPKLEQVEQVTAAHEMLHAAYDRLSGNEKDRVDRLLIELYESLEEGRIVDTIEQYASRDPTSINNELHSIIGTEVAEIGVELEEYYSQYFSDRSVVVDISQEYEQVFTDIEQKLDDLKRRLENLSTNIEAKNGELTALQASLNQRRAELDALLADNQVAAYNSRVPSYNAMVSTFNAGIAEYESMIDRYNNLVSQHNELKFEQDELINSLNSHFEPIE